MRYDRLSWFNGIMAGSAIGALSALFNVAEPGVLGTSFFIVGYIVTGIWLVYGPDKRTRNDPNY